MKRNAILLILIISMPVVIAGCINLSKPAPDKRYFSLDVASEGDVTDAALGKTLKVLPFDISPIYARRQLVYRNMDMEYEADFYNEFFSDPSSMISGQTLNWLQSSGLFQYVIADRSRVQASHLLEGNIVKLYIDLREKSHPKAQIEIQFFLLKNGDVTRTVIFHETYSATVPVASTSTHDLVEGLNTALKQILTDFANDLNRDRKSYSN